MASARLGSADGAPLSSDAPDAVAEARESGKHVLHQ